MGSWWAFPEVFLGSPTSAPQLLGRVCPSRANRSKQSPGLEGPDLSGKPFSIGPFRLLAPLPDVYRTFFVAGTLYTEERDPGTRLAPSPLVQNGIGRVPIPKTSGPGETRSRPDRHPPYQSSPRHSSPGPDPGSRRVPIQPQDRYPGIRAHASPLTTFSRTRELGSRPAIHSPSRTATFVSPVPARTLPFGMSRASSSAAKRRRVRAS